MRWRTFARFASYPRPPSAAHRRDDTRPRASCSRKSDLREDWWPTTLRGWSARPWSRRIDPAAARFARHSFAGDTTAWDGADGRRSHPSLDPPRENGPELAKTVRTAPRYVTRNPVWSTRRGPPRRHPRPRAPRTRRVYRSARRRALYRRAVCHMTFSQFGAMC